MDAEAAGDEFQALFVGVGKSEVSLYASHYLGPQSGRPLAEIRATLAALGSRAGRGAASSRTTCRVVLETMRMLVAGDAERRPAPIAEQRAFFERHLLPWAFDCCAAISNCPLANYYRQRRINSPVASWRSNVTRSPSNDYIKVTRFFWRSACAFPRVAFAPPRPFRSPLLPPPIRNAAASCSRWAWAARAPLRPPSPRHPPRPCDAVTAAPDAPADGYRETAHVRDYYRTAKL